MLKNRNDNNDDGQTETNCNDERSHAFFRAKKIYGLTSVLNFVYIHVGKYMLSGNFVDQEWVEDKGHDQG